MRSMFLKERDGAVTSLLTLRKDSASADRLVLNPVTYFHCCESAEDRKPKYFQNFEVHFQARNDVCSGPAEPAVTQAHKKRNLFHPQQCQRTTSGLCTSLTVHIKNLRNSTWVI